MVTITAWLAVFAGCSGSDKPASENHANALAHDFIIVDTHIDVPYRLREKAADISQRTEDGEFDYPRARAGGLDGAFMSIYTPADLETSGGSKQLADSLIDMVEGFATRWPDKFGLASSPQDAAKLNREGRFSLFMGMENGSPIEGDLANVEYFYERGVRYITLTHSKDNHICDSSYDTLQTWNGLSPFGRQVVSEMNRVGIMIDVSHVSDSTFYQVIELSTAPVIASHSSCRYFTPGFQRNMSDEMIETLARAGGVIQINFGSTFINQAVRERYDAGRQAAIAWGKARGLAYEDETVEAYKKAYFEENPHGFADVSDVADHIDHVVTLVGVDHVGFGSDFDGVGDTLPTGLKDVSYYPNLINELLNRGYSDDDIEKMCSGNLFRVMAGVASVPHGPNASR